MRCGGRQRHKPFGHPIFLHYAWRPRVSHRRPRSPPVLSCRKSAQGGRPAPQRLPDAPVHVREIARGLRVNTALESGDLAVAGVFRRRRSGPAAGGIHYAVLWFSNAFHGTANATPDPRHTRAGRRPNHPRRREGPSALTSAGAGGPFSLRSLSPAPTCSIRKPAPPPAFRGPYHRAPPGASGPGFLDEVRPPRNSRPVW